MHIERFVEVQNTEFGDHIIKAAVKVGTVIYTGWRHNAIRYHLINENICAPPRENEGFIDNKMIFHNRYVAGKIAFCANQMHARRMGHELISEELWDNNGKFHVPKEQWRLTDEH